MSLFKNNLNFLSEDSKFEKLFLERKFRCFSFCFQANKISKFTQSTTKQTETCQLSFTYHMYMLFLEERKIREPTGDFQ